MQDGTAPPQFFQAREFVPAVSLVIANGVPVASPLIAAANTAPFVPETLGDAVDVPQVYLSMYIDVCAVVAVCGALIEALFRLASISCYFHDSRNGVTMPPFWFLVWER